MTRNGLLNLTLTYRKFIEIFFNCQVLRLKNFIFFEKNFAKIFDNLIYIIYIIYNPGFKSINPGWSSVRTFELISES